MKMQVSRRKLLGMLAGGLLAPQESMTGSLEGIRYVLPAKAAAATKYLTRVGMQEVPHITPRNLSEIWRLTPEGLRKGRILGRTHNEDVGDLESIARELAGKAQQGGISLLPEDTQQQAAQFMKEIAKRGVRSKFEKLYPDTGPLRRELYSKHLEHYAAGRDFMERCLMGGNRIGKTVCGAFETTAHLTGNYPDWWNGRVFNEPGRWWACGKSNEKLVEIVQEELFGGTKKTEGGRWRINGTGMIPPEAIVGESVTFRQGYSGLVGSVEIRYKDSLVERAKVELKAYEQKRGAFEGTARQGIWCDEEPPEDIYSECCMRISTLDGLMILTFTPLEGHTEVVESFLDEEMRPASVSPIYTEF